MNAKTPSNVTIKNASRYLHNGIRRGGDKVSAVRALAAYRDPETREQLRRRDVFAIIRAAKFQVSDATISTQFQLVRSGKLRIQYS